MRFSTRTAFVFTLFAGLVAAAIGLSVSRSHLQNTINELQNLHGILVDENEEDRVELTSIGPGLPFKYGAQLFRVENYRDYDLEVSFVFTSWPETTEKQIVRLNSPQYALSYDERSRQLCVQPTFGSHHGDKHRIEIPPGGNLVSITQKSPNGLSTISGTPFLVVLFGKQPAIASVNFEFESKNDIEKFCGGIGQYDAVMFTLLRKNDRTKR